MQRRPRFPRWAARPEPGPRPGGPRATPHPRRLGLEAARAADAVVGRRRGPAASVGRVAPRRTGAAAAAIGQPSAYAARASAAGVTLANPAGGFSARVQSGGLQVSAGADTWSTSLLGVDDGSGCSPRELRNVGRRQPRRLQLRDRRRVVRQWPGRIGARLQRRPAVRNRPPAAPWRSSWPWAAI